MLCHILLSQMNVLDCVSEFFYADFLNFVMLKGIMLDVVMKYALTLSVIVPVALSG